MKSTCIFILIISLIMPVVSQPEIKEEISIKYDRKNDEKYLRSLGAEKIVFDDCSDEYHFENGMILVVRYESNFVYESDRIASMNVFYDPDLLKNDESRRCMYLPTHEQFLSYINKLRPLGSFLGYDPIDIVPTSGWRRRTKEYKNANCLISVENCEDPDPTYGCCIDWFSVSFWMSISGEVESKEKKEISIGDTPFYEYILIILGNPIIVSKEEYDRITIGKRITLRVIHSGQKSYYTKEHRKRYRQ